MREQSTTNNIFQPKHVRGGETKVMKAMKKSILTFLAFALVFTMAMPAFAANVATGAQYSDIEDGNVAAAVKVLSSLDVLKGYPDGTFKPDNTITRAEFAAVAVRLLGYEKAAQASQGKTQFKDEVLPWASGYVNVASQQQILTGYPDGTFRANQPVTQAEALTILVRALGYEPVVDKAGWPYNYIVVADQIGLTKDLDVVANQSATRGFVAQASKTALTEPKLVQVGFGDMKQYVVSGTNNTDLKTILEDNLKYESGKDVVVAIPRTDKKLKDAVKFEKAGTLDVPAGFDFEEAFGATIKYYVNSDDEIIYSTVVSDVYYDAVKVNTKGTELTLVDADTKYDIADKAIVYVNGEKATVADLTDKKFNYGKVVMNDDDEACFIQVYNLNSFIVVDKVTDNLVTGYNDELNIKDFAIVKDGKTVNAENLAANDILFYNAKAKYAEVYNNATTGELSKVFSDSFKVDTKTFKIELAKYINGDKLDALTSSVLDDMKEAAKDVTAFVDRAGTLVLVSGDLGKAATSEFHALVIADSTPYQLRATNYHNLDILTPAGEVKKFDIKDTDIAKADFFKAPATMGITDVKKGEVVKVTLDDENTVKSFELLDDAVEVVAPTEVKYDDKYVGKYQLQNDAVVFLTEGKTDLTKSKTMTWGEVEDTFSVVKAAKFYANDKDKVTAIVVSKSNADADSKEYTGVITDLRKFTGSTSKWEITVEIEGKEFVYVTDTNNVKDADMTGIAKKDVVTIKVGDKSGAIVGITEVTAAQDNKLITNNVNVSNRTIEVNSVTYELVSTAVIYDEDMDIITLSDLSKDDTVKVFTAVNGSRFANYVLRTAAVDGTPEDTSLVVITKDMVETTTADVVKVNVDNNNTTVYKVEVYSSDAQLVTSLSTIVDKTYTAADLTKNVTPVPTASAIADVVAGGTEYTFLVKVINQDTKAVVGSAIVKVK